MDLLVLIIILAIIVVVELIYYRNHALDDLDLSVKFSKNVANHGEEIEVIEVAENNKRLPLPFIILKFETPAVLQFMDMTNTTLSDLLYREDMLTMRPFSRHTRKIKAKCTKRGFYSFTRVNMTTTDLLLIEKFTKEFPNDCSVTILPERIATDRLKYLLSLTLSEVQRKRTILTDPFAFAGIREYQPWDPMKSINWLASARTGDFMVNQNASTSTRQVTIFVNLEYYNQKHSDSLLETSISLAYSFMCELSEMGIPTAIYTNGKDVLSDAPVISGMNLNVNDVAQRAVELARIDLTKECLPFEYLVEQYVAQTDRDDFIVVISPKFDGSFKPAMLNLKHKRSSALWIMPCYKLTPEVPLENELQSSYHRWEVIGHD
ncbi:MAG: DUF58 domain-containing protein [Clostridiales bacterium]|nr:DUF58 domain-containing protein [Clostridiales bacterium]